MISLRGRVSKTHSKKAHMFRLVPAFTALVFVFQIAATSFVPFTALAYNRDNEPSAPEVENQIDYEPTGIFGDNQPETANQIAERTELVDRRDRFSDTFLETDGTLTTRRYSQSKNFLKDDQWQTIDASLREDLNPTNSGLLGSTYGRLKSAFTNEKTFVTGDNEWRAQFAPTNDDVGMVRIAMGDDLVVYRPVGAADVTPTLETSGDYEYMNYHEVWPGVDVQYELLPDGIKQNIIVKNADAANRFSFDIEGAQLEQHPDVNGAYLIKGSLNDEFIIKPINLIRNNHGHVSEDVYRYEYANNQLTSVVDRDYIDSLPDDAFPLAIDPHTHREHHNSNNVVWNSFKGDGYTCDSNLCYVQFGTIIDQGFYVPWRTSLHTHYAFLNGKQLVSAKLHLNKRNQAGVYTGNNIARSLQAVQATCHNAPECTGTLSSPAISFATSGTLDVTGLYQDWMQAGNYGAWLMLIGDEGCLCDAYKQIDNHSSYTEFNYTQAPVETTALTPYQNEVIVTNQPSLLVNPVAPPTPGDTIQYRFHVATGSDALSGTLFNSGWVSQQQWTVPEGVLQNGQTYYWRVDTATAVNDHRYAITQSSWVRSFKVKLRQGQDETQTYDDSGPISVGLATGNVTTSAASHGIGALGGDISIGLEYNSPVHSQNGLVGEYFNNANWTGPAALSRVDKEVKFNWSNGSPSAGIIANDNHSIRWEGYFVAPEDGDYQFGGLADDQLKIFVDDTLVTDVNCCGGVKWGATNTTLSVGQVVPIRVDFREIGGASAVDLRVRGAVDEQIVPSEWLRTKLRPIRDTQGLKAHYYYETANREIPNNTLAAFSSGVAPHVNLNWGNKAPVPGGPLDNWMARYEGYITAPFSGTYQLATASDDGARITINGDNRIVDDWAVDTNIMDRRWSGSFTMTAGEPVPITVDYFEKGGTAAVQLWVRGAVGEQIVPATWLSNDTQPVPKGWAMSLGVDGNVAYDFAQINSNNVILADASGSRHEYKWNGSAYEAPEGEYGVMTRNDTDGSIRLAEASGKTYVFNSNGTLREVMSVLDDRKPAALRYEYSGTPARLSKIIDGVDPSRYGEVHYGGSDSCPDVPSGFNDAPGAMLCGFSTTDGQTTEFHYKNGRLALITLPGDTHTTIGYDEHGRITSQRSSLAHDVVNAGVRSDNESVETTIEYDVIGRAMKVTSPSANEGDTRDHHSYKYLVDAHGEQWTEPEVIPDVSSVANPVVANYGEDNVALLMRDTTTNDRLIVRQYQDGQWGDWISQGGCLRSDPAGSSMNDGRLDIFVRGCNDGLHHKLMNSAGVWSGWNAASGGLINSSPSAVSWGDGRIDIVARGHDNTIQKGSFSSGHGWANFSSRGGCMATAPAAASWAENQLFNYYADCDSSQPNLFAYNFFQGWNPITRTASTDNLASAPSAVALPTKEIHVVARDTQNRLRHRYHNGHAWREFETVVDCIEGRPSIAKAGGRTVVVAYRGCDGQVYQTKRTPVLGSTQLHVSTGDGPNGYSDRIEYDDLYRTVRDYTDTGHIATAEYHPYKDLVLSTTSATGLKGATIYNQDELAETVYGAAPAEWFDANRAPLPQHVDQVSRVDTAYDQGINGFDVAWFEAVVNGNGRALVNAPKLHTTGFAPDHDNRDLTWRNFATNKPAELAGRADYGFTAKGRITLPQTGDYTFKGIFDDGARLFFDDKKVWGGDTWNVSTAGPATNTRAGTFKAIAGRTYDIRIEYVHLAQGSGDGSFELKVSGPGVAETNRLGEMVKPGYNLTTSTTAYDSTLGNRTATTDYGPNPEYGLAQSATADVGGLNLSSSSTYESADQTDGFLRQTSSSLPGGNTTTFAYYGATESVDNPCTTEPDAVSQAGRQKITTEQDPDANGPATGRTIETVYDSAGRAVATRMNDDPWTCVSFDTRGRTVHSHQPDINGRPGRTNQTFYDHDGNPLRTRTTDSIVGDNVTTIDLLGRNVSTVDIWGNTNNVSYDDQGRVNSKTTQAGVETYDYDEYDRVTNYKLDDVILSTTTYDEYGRVESINYPEAKDDNGNTLKLIEIKRDALQRSIGGRYQTSDGKIFDEDINITQSGQVIGATQNFDGQTIASNYTFDGIGRLTDATVGNTRYQYGYGAPDGSCAGGTGHNANSHLSSNRSTYRVSNTGTGATITDHTYCYDQGDRLVNTSDDQVGAPVYDDHGNITQINGGGEPINFAYNASDHNIAIEQGGNKVEYTKTAGGAVVRKKEWRDGQSSRSYRYLAGGSVLQLCNLADDNACQTLDRYVSLAGGVTMTVGVHDLVDQEPDPDPDPEPETVNQLPDAKAGLDQQVTDTDENGSESVTLDAGNSTDADGTIAGYAWVKDGQEVSTDAAPTFDLGVGDHTYTLTVTDDQGGQDTDQVTIQVIAPGGGGGPSGDPSTLQVIAASNDGSEVIDIEIDGQIVDSFTVTQRAMGRKGKWQTYTYNHSASLHPSQVRLLYQNDGRGASGRSRNARINLINIDGTDYPAAAAGNISEGVKINGTGNCLPEGDHQSDWLMCNGFVAFTGFGSNPGGGGSPPPNQAPQPDAGPNQFIETTNATETVILSASATDADGQIVSDRWTDSDGNVIPGSASAIVDLAPGTHTLTYEATDDDGAVNTDHTIIQIVSIDDDPDPDPDPDPENQAPQVDAGPDQTIETDQSQVTVNLSGSAADPDGTIDGYRWLNASGVTLATTANATVDLTPGTHVLTLEATDNDGATATDTVTIEVVDTSTPPSGDPSTLQVIAASNDGSEVIDIEIDGQIVDSFTVTQRAMGRKGKWQTYTYDHSTNLHPSQVRLLYQNDGRGSSGRARNLRIQMINIDGTDYRTDAPGNTQLGAKTNGTGSCLPAGDHQSDWIMCNGYVEYGGFGAAQSAGLDSATATFKDSTSDDIQQTESQANAASTITIHARGNTGSEHMQLSINGSTVANWHNVGTDMATYDYTVTESTTINSIRVHSINPTNQGWPHAMEIDKITIDGIDYQSEASTTRSIGSWNSSAANPTCGEGYSSIEWINCGWPSDIWFEYEAAHGVALTGTNTNPSDPPELNQPTITYTLTNFHGDTALVLNNKAIATSTLMAYGPFGDSLPVGSIGSVPLDTEGNTEDGSRNSTNENMGWAADPSRKVEGMFSVPLIQMGARVYLPTMGRFLQMDSVRGGNLNTYIYTHDPINMQDYSGQFAIFIPVIAYKAAIAAVALYGAYQVGQAAADADIDISISLPSGPTTANPPPSNGGININPGIYAVPAAATAAEFIQPRSDIRVRSNAKTSTKTRSNPNKRGYTPRPAEIRTVGFSQATFDVVTSNPTSSEAIAVGQVVSALSLGARPGIPIMRLGPNDDPRYNGYTKYAYNTIDAYTGKRIEIHYNLRSISRGTGFYGDLKIKY